MKQNIKITAIVLGTISFVRGAGISSAISMSNTRNTTARMKNCNENGMRADEIGSNPHSKGVIFSILFFCRIFKMNVAAIITAGKIVATAVEASIKEMRHLLGGCPLLMK